MGSILERLQRALELRGGINGMKMLLGAAIIVLSHQIGMLQDLINVYPESSALEVALSYVEIALGWTEKIALWAGNLLLVVGAGDKVKKFVKP